MKTDIEIEDDVYVYVSTSPLAGAIGGKVYKGERLLGSLTEDMTINVLANNVTELQAAFVNVNIYVKDLNLKGQYVKDSARLRTLCRECWEAFKTVVGEDYRVTMDSQRVISDSGSENYHEHIINNKLRYQHYNYN